MQVKCFLFCFLIAYIQPIFGQQQRISSFEKAKKEVSPIDEIKFRNIGPTIMSGRVTDLEVNPDNVNEFYIAYASGGLFHTINNGQSMEPVFDQEATITIGDIAVNWKHNLIWIGTGEDNSSRSSYAGVGLYTSNDRGKTWVHKGLPESHHIGKIILHPDNPAIAWVAVLGHLYTHNKERGIYKTTDAGNNWSQTLYINDSTGCVDLQIDPLNANTLYAASWTRTRKAWNFNGVGAASGIYKSTDGGEQWQLLSTQQSGFPTGNQVGRIGLSIFNKNPAILYAVVDNQMNQPEKKKDASQDEKLTARKLALMNTNDFLQLDDATINDYLKQQGYPAKYQAASLKKSIRQQTFTVKDIADWKLADADASLFDTPIYGAELYRSDDAGISWHKTHEGDMSGVVFTYGYYFGTVQVSPNNADKVFIAGYPLLMSEDGGKHFTQIDGDNCHPDYHSIWINSQNDRHLITGNDGGVNITYDDGKHWIKANNPAVGQFYAIQVDNASPYNVYGGLQDNGTWVGPSNHTESTAWHQNGVYGYKNIGEGDGMQVQVDTRNNNTYFVGYQFGNYYKAQKDNDDVLDVKPIHDIGNAPYRFNWQTPIWLSRHNQDVFYIGSNCLHRSLLQGEALETLSADLTQANRKGNVPFNTLTCIHESPRRFGLLYTGSDDGLVHISKDGGYTWINISAGLPDDLWVSRVTASQHQLNRVYVSLNGYRNDDFTPYLFVSDDEGAHWKSLGKNLPQEPINVVKEDPKDEQILYVGTDNGLYVSFDKGNHFIPWNGHLPRVAIHDIAIQERENDIVLGTHGRSIYIANLDKIQAYNQVKDKNWVTFDIDKIIYNKHLGNKSFSYSTPNTKKINIAFYTQEAALYDIHILSTQGELLYTTTHQAVNGINILNYDLSINQTIKQVNQQPLQTRDDGKYYLPIGKYQIEFISPKGEKHIQTFEITEPNKK